MTMNSAVKIALLILLAAICIGYVKYRLTPKVPFHMEGGSDPKFAKVGRAFKTAVENGLLGGAFAVYHKGRLVVDVWGGYADVENLKKFTKETASLLMSCTKGVAAICVALMAERGLLKYDDLVSKHWPEFAQNGKEKVTIRQLMSHQAGLVAFDEKIILDDLIHNPDKVGRLLARQKPVWEPGTGHGYHMYSFGFFVDQLIRHVDKKNRSLQQFFQEEIADPFDIDMAIGLTEKHASRFAVATEQGPLDFLETVTSGSGIQLLLFFNMLYRPDSLPARGNDIAEPRIFVPGWPRRPELLKYPIGSATGVGTARAVAKLYSLIVSGDPKTGKKLLSENILKELTTGTRGMDLVLNWNMTFSAGMLPLTSPKGTPIFGHPGFGGNFGYADPKHELSWSFITNHHKLINVKQDVRYHNLVRAVYECLDD